MTLGSLLSFAREKANFLALESYVDFSRRFLEFTESGLQAVIVSQNEPSYRFYQYKEEGNFNITRPINAQLMLDIASAEALFLEFLGAFASASDLPGSDTARRSLICNAIYTIQQSIGATLDALPAGESNTARKINGDLFERLIRLLLEKAGVHCTSGTVRVPIVVDGEELCRMDYQHDLVVKEGEFVKLLGSVKTSSKDRIDKIFLDKFLFSQLTGTATPHVAIFLNDVQRKNAGERKYGISATFLPGHFKGYTMKLNPLDGVYYCDLRPNMRTDGFLKTRIHAVDRFFCDDIWQFIRRPGGATALTIKEYDE